MKFKNEVHYDYDNTQPFSLLYSYISNDNGNIFERTDFEYYVFEFVLEGSGTVIIDGSTRFMPQQNDVLILPKYHDHKFYSDKKGPWRKIFFIADGPVIEHLLRAYKLEGIFLFKNCNLKEMFFEMRNVFLSVDPGLNSDAAVIFHKMAQAMHESINPETQHFSMDVFNIKKILDANISGKIDLNKICSQLGKSKSHIISNFKKETGGTPYDYLLNKKIELAKKLLLSTNFSVKEIAERLKFADQYYFSGLFKKKTGFSPKAFKENYK